jgi:hypothetical protein
LRLQAYLAYLAGRQLQQGCWRGSQPEAGPEQTVDDDTERQLHSIHQRGFSIRIDEFWRLPVTWLAPGQPNCNEDANVNMGDAICVRNLVLN